MKSLKLSAIIISAGIVILSVLISSAVYARNYNYDVLEKAQSLQFEGTFTVKRDGQTMDVHELNSGDEITGFSNTNAYDSGFNPGECKQFVNIILYEVAGDHDLPNNGCINGACGGYYDNFSKDIRDVVPGDILHCYYGGGVWHTMVAMAGPELDENEDPKRIYVLDSNWTSYHTVALRYHDLKKYTTYGYSKGWEYTMSFVDQSNDKCGEDPITLAPNGTVNVTIRWKNEGRESWSNDPIDPTNIFLAASDHLLDPTQPPPTRHSSCAHNWVDSDWKVAYPDEALIEMGQIATFTFEIQAPPTLGVYEEYFYPYHVSGGWIPNRDTEFPGVHFTIIVEDDVVIDVGQGAPTGEIEQAFVNVWNTNSANLGPATGAVQPAASSFGTGGYYQTFKYGSIQYLDDGPYAGQGFALYGKLYEKWGNMGYANSPLGFPTANRVDATSSFGTYGTYQLFEGGSLQLNGIDPFAVYGAEYEKWGELGYAAGHLGFPVGDRIDASSGFGTEGWYQLFEGGSVQVIAADAYSIYGEIYREWGRQGYATWVGFPTNDRYSCEAGDCQDFEGGCIEYDGQTAQFISTTHPANLTAEVNPDASVDLSWENRITAQGINVYRKGSPVERIAVLDPSETSYLDDTAEEGHHYIYYLGAYNETAESPYSNKMAVNGGLLDNGPWPMFQCGIKHIGQSNYMVGSKPLLKWRSHIDGYIDSSPAISSDGTIYIGNLDRTASGWNEYLYAFDSDGNLKWQYQMPDHVSISSSPAIGSDGTIYIGAYWYYISYSPRGYVYAITPDGNLKWKYDIGESSIYSSPAIDSNGTIFIGADNGYLYAIYPDGTLKWRYQTGGDVKSSPAIDSRGTIYVGSHDKYLYAIHPDGTLKWRYQTIDAVILSPSIDSNETIYVGSFNTRWWYTTNYLYAINPDGSLKWTYQTEGAIESSPAIDSRGTIYVGSHDKYLYAIHPDGTLKWRYQTDGAIHSSPAIDSNGTVYVGANDYYFYAIGLQAGKGELYGNIRDFGTLSSIANANISADGISSQSKPSGFYNLSLDSGIYDITFSKTGYQTVTIPDVVVTARKFTELNIELNIDGPLNIVTTDLPPAEAGVEYNDRVRISGGISPYTYSIAYGFLPPGLSLDASYGNITGTPTSAGSYTFAVGVEDAEAAYAEREFNIEVTEQLQIITKSPLARGTRGVSYFQSVEATGGTLPYNFSKSAGTLPPGLSLSADGSLSGTPSSTGSYDFTVKVTDASGRTAEKAFNLEIVDSLVITTSRLNDGIVGEPYNQTMTASGGYGAYNWGVYSGILPAGLSLDSLSGVISGTPGEATYGTIVISVSDEDGRITYQDFTLQVSDPLQILTTTLPDGLRNEPYSEAIRVRGGVEPFTFGYTGQLPEGLSLNPSTGIISGTPTLAGYTNVSITVSDSTYPTSQAVTQNLGIRITSQLTILTSAVLPNGKKGVAFNPIVLVAGGGVSPYEWAITGGYMPEGITLNSQTGELSGTPLDRGDFVFTIEVTDQNTDTAQKEFFLHVSGDLIIVSNVIADGAKNVPYSFTLEAQGGILHYDWRVKSGTLPSGLFFNENTGTIYGTPTTRQTYSFTIEVNDSDSPAQVAEKTYVMEVLDDLYIYTKTIPNGRVDEAYTATISAELGTPPYSWRVESGMLPPGLTLSSSPTVATIEGNPTATGTYVFTLEVSDTDAPVKYATQEYTVHIYGDVFIETTGLQCAFRGVPYSDSIVVTGGELPHTWTLTQGNLPVGLTLNSTSGHLSGITNLVTGQSSTFTVRVTDSGSPYGFDEKELVIYVIDPLTIITESIQEALVDTYYQVTLQGEGGISPYHWSIQSGGLPEGLDLNSDTGVIAGYASECGAFNFTVMLEDSSPVPNTATRAYNLNVTAINDWDCDGLPNVLEETTCTDPYDADTDDDGISDGVEDANHNGVMDYGETDPCDIDTDDDGIQDGTELGYTLYDIGPDTDTDVFQPDLDPSTTTDPLDEDTDNDGLLDGEEDTNHNGRVDPGERDPNIKDSRATMPWLQLLLFGD